MTLLPPRALVTVLLGAGLALFATDANAAPPAAAAKHKRPQVQQDPMETENSPPPPTDSAPADKPGPEKDGGSPPSRPSRSSGSGSSSSSGGSSSSGSSGSSGSGSDAGAAEKAGFFMFNLKIGPALCAYPNNCAHQGSVVLELGAALTANRNGYLVLPVQFQFQPAASAIIVPIGFQYDVRLPKRGLYLYPRISAGYAALLTNVPTGGSPSNLLHSGIIIAELGLKYVLRGRWNLGGELVSLPLFLNSSGAQLFYRVHLSAGVNF